MSRAEIAEQQIAQCLNLLHEVLADHLLAVYLYGSAIVGGLQKYSDIDLFVVSDRKTTLAEKTFLTQKLLALSGIYMKEDRFPLEVTIVVHSEINPWHYPPHFDFQYGEWLRETFENGIIEPWPTKQMPDLALLITQILLASKTLYAKKTNVLLPNIPHHDVITAMTDELHPLLAALNTDTRNVLLTLARIWQTSTSSVICSKLEAANWAIAHLPAEHQAVMQRAKSIYLGEKLEFWDDLHSQLKPCADFILKQITQS